MYAVLSSRVDLKCTVIFIDRAKKMKCTFILLVQTILMKRSKPIRLKSSRSCFTSLCRATFVMHLELAPTRKLARVNVLHVLDSLQTKGFFIQMPPEGLINPNAVEPEGLRGA